MSAPPAGQFSAGVNSEAMRDAIAKPSLSVGQAINSATDRGAASLVTAFGEASRSAAQDRLTATS